MIFEGCVCNRCFNSIQSLLPNNNTQVIREFGYLVRCITSTEAINLGIFLKEILAMVEHWKDAGVFESECSGTDAFLTWQGDKSTPITYQQYSILCFNWQKVGSAS